MEQLPDKLIWTKCNCGHPRCLREYPANLGHFYQGTGFEPHQKTAVEIAWNLYTTKKQAFAKAQGYPEACELDRNGECKMCGRPCDEEMRKACMAKTIADHFAEAPPDMSLLSAQCPDEDWFEEIISDSLDMDWSPRTAAKAIVAAWVERWTPQHPHEEPIVRVAVYCTPCADKYISNIAVTNIDGDYLCQDCADKCRGAR